MGWNEPRMYQDKLKSNIMEMEDLRKSSTGKKRTINRAEKYHDALAARFEPGDTLEPRIGIYTKVEREKRLQAYREKRKSRSYGKIRYDRRRDASKARIRYQGRFVKLSDVDQLSLGKSNDENRASEETESTSQDLSSDTEPALDWMDGVLSGDTNPVLAIDV